MIYYLIFLFLAALSVFEYRVKSSGITKTQSAVKVINSCAVFFIVLLISFSGFRYYVGYDYQSYRDIYNGFSGYDILNFDLAFVFQIIIKFCKSLGFGFYGFIFITALLSISLKFLVIKRLSPFLFLSICLFFSQEYLARDFSNIRQGLAIAFIALSVLFFLEKKFFYCSLFFFLGFLSHATAIIFILFYFISFLNFKPSRLFLIISVFFSLFIGQYILNEGNLIRILSMINVGYISQKLADYSSRAEYSSEIGLSFGAIQRIFIFTLFVYFEKSLSHIRGYYQIRIISWIGLLVFFLFNSFEIIAARGSYYFRFFDVIIYAYLPLALKGNKFKFALFLLVLLYSFQGLYREINRSSVFTPYMSVFFNSDKL